MLIRYKESLPCTSVDIIVSKVSFFFSLFFRVISECIQSLIPWTVHNSIIIIVLSFNEILIAPNNILNGNLLYMSMFTLDVAALSCFSGL